MRFSTSRRSSARGTCPTHAGEIHFKDQQRGPHGDAQCRTPIFRIGRSILYVDGELWGKVKYGRPMSREIPPGPHKIRAFNTLFSHTIDIDAVPGEHVKLRCTNAMPTVGWLMMMFLHVTALRVRLERDQN